MKAFAAVVKVSCKHGLRLVAREKKYCADPEEEVPQESCTAFSCLNSGFVCRTEQFDFFSYSSFDSFCARSKEFTRIESFTLLIFAVWLFLFSSSHSFSLNSYASSIAGFPLKKLLSRSFSCGFSLSPFPQRISNLSIPLYFFLRTLAIQAKRE